MPAMSPRRTFPLDLGDAAKLAGTEPPRQQRHRPADRRSARPADKDAPVWKPGKDARTVGVEDGVRLSTYIARISGLSGRMARRLIEQGCVRINGRVEGFASCELRRGMVVEVFLPEAEREHRFDVARMPFADEAMLAYDKPPWLPVTPTEGPKSWSLADILAAALPPPVIPVHRLDADTSGLVLFARAERPARRLEAMFREHQVRKTYLAIVRGHPRDQGEHRSYLIKVSSGKGFERWRSGHGPDAREAITTWEVLDHLGPWGSLVRITPKTGRYHQIRIHFSEMGCPLYGDILYGDKADPVQAPRHMLHAWRVELAHPVSGEALSIEAPPPEDFETLAKALRERG
jgi:RluA family pseudouridine synthase